MSHNYKGIVALSAAPKLLRDQACSFCNLKCLKIENHQTAPYYEDDVIKYLAQQLSKCLNLLSPPFEHQQIPSVMFIYSSFLIH